MDASELGLEGVVGVHGDGDAADGDGSGGGDRLLQRGDDEAGVGLAGEVLGLGDDAPCSGPALTGGVGEVLEASRGAVAPEGVGLGGGEFRLDPSGEPFVPGDADDVVVVLLFAEGHDLFAGVGGVGADEDLDAGPAAAARGWWPQKMYSGKKQ